MKKESERTKIMLHSQPHSQGRGGDGDGGGGKLSTRGSVP